MRRKRSKTHQAASLPRTDRRLKAHDDDAYGLSGKLPDPTCCTECAAVYRAGRWTWAAAAADAHRTRCPACRRIEADDPAGLVFVEGAFADAHRQEIQGLVRHVEEREKQEHPLKRVMRITERDGGLEIATTDVRLARGLGEALYDAYKGDLEYHFTEPGNVIRVHWRR